MVCERSVLRIFRIELGMNHLCPDHEVVAQLRAVGVLTQKNLTKKLNGVKNVLPRHEKAEVYTIWLREQRPSDPQIVAKTQEYCRYLSELRLGAVDVLDIWDACTRHIVESLDPTEVREKARVLHNITEMSHRIEDCFKVQDQNADITMSSKEKKKRTKNTKLQIKAEPALPRVKLETENNSLPCAGRIILQNQQNLSSASISSSRTRFGTSYGTLNTGVDATRSELQGRDNEPARVALDSHHSNSTGASADSASKIHPMFSFTPRHNPSPIFPARTLDSNRLSITSALSPTSIDLTHDQDHSRSNKTEYRSPGSLFIGDDSDDEMGNLPEGYVCKRCSEPGHHIKQCPKLHNKKYDSRPDPEYECHACGQKGDHFITSCAKRKPDYHFQKKKAQIVLDKRQENHTGPSESRPWTETGFGPCNETEPVEAAGTAPNASKHSRKRSADVEFLSERRKRPRGAKIEVDRPLNSEPVPSLLAPKELRSRKRLPNEGRLSPWGIDRNDDDLQISFFDSFAEQIDLTASPSPPSAPPIRRSSRAKIIADVEAESFLRELAREYEKEQPEDKQAAHRDGPEAMLPADLERKAPDYGVPLRARSGGTTAIEAYGNKAPLKEDTMQLHWPQNLCDTEYLEDQFLAGDNVDEPSSPATSRTPPDIKFYITEKSLYSFDLKMLPLFNNVSNVWVQKVSRRTALDMWCQLEAETNLDQQHSEPYARSMQVQQDNEKRPLSRSPEAATANGETKAGRLSPVCSTAPESSELA